MTDLTKEWLNGLDGEVAEAIAEWGEEDPVQIGDALMTRVALREFRQLIAMAKRTEAAERRATDMERLSRYETNFRETAERERDEWRAFAQRTEIWDAGGCCAFCGEEEGHTGSCLWRIAALAQSTDAGGDAS